MKRTVTLLLVGLLSVTAFTSALVRRAPIQAQDPLPITPVPISNKLQGATSCATSVCHGGGVVGAKQSEFFTWQSLDPHARAYATLLSADSKKIADRHFGGGTLAHEAPLCLKCHVHPDYDSAEPRKSARANFRKEDGVSCESCHGAAERWLPTHYRAEWKTTDQAARHALGVRNTKALAVRAAVCVGCHVGSPDVQVDHDLIAAGHPPLRFEFAAYFANLPRHWDGVADKKRESGKTETGSDFEARAWRVGQLTSAARALRLHAHRAAPKNGKTWPEFSELDCFACHHDLQETAWRRDAGPLQKRRPGSFAGNDWYDAMLADLLTTVDRPAAVELLAEVQAFKTGKPSAWFAEEGRGQQARRAASLAESLEKLAHQPREESDPCSSDAWLRRLTINRPADRSWDAASQRYLALAALRQARVDMEKIVDAPLEQQIQTLWQRVRIPSRSDSPKQFQPASR